MVIDNRLFGHRAEKWCRPSVAFRYGPERAVHEAVRHEEEELGHLQNV